MIMGYLKLICNIGHKSNSKRNSFLFKINIFFFCLFLPKSYGSAQDHSDIKQLIRNKEKINKYTPNKKFELVSI